MAIISPNTYNIKQHGQIHYGNHQSEHLQHQTTRSDPLWQSSVRTPTTSNNTVRSTMAIISPNTYNIKQHGQIHYGNHQSEHLQHQTTRSDPLWQSSVRTPTTSNNTVRSTMAIISPNTYNIKQHGQIHYGNHQSEHLQHQTTRSDPLWQPSVRTPTTSNNTVRSTMAIISPNTYNIKQLGQIHYGNHQSKRKLFESKLKKFLS